MANHLVCMKYAVSCSYSKLQNELEIAASADLETELDPYYEDIREESRKYNDVEYIVRRVYLSSKDSSSYDASSLSTVGWVINEGIPMCLGCHEPFSYIYSARKRHHCRTCGNLLCSECLANEAIIKDFEELGTQRVCNACNPRLLETVSLRPNKQWGASILVEEGEQQTIMTATERADTSAQIAAAGLGDKVVTYNLKRLRQNEDGERIAVGARVAYKSPEVLHIQPFPGFVIKTRRIGDEGSKVFINVFHHKEIKDKELLLTFIPFTSDSMHNGEVVSFDPTLEPNLQCWPLIYIGDCTTTEDKKGYVSLLYNVVVSSFYLESEALIEHPYPLTHPTSANKIIQVINKYFQDTLYEDAFVLPHVKQRFHGLPLTGPAKYRRNPHWVAYVPFERINPNYTGGEIIKRTPRLEASPWNILPHEQSRDEHSQAEKSNSQPRSAAQQEQPAPLYVNTSTYIFDNIYVTQAQSMNNHNFEGAFAGSQVTPSVPLPGSRSSHNNNKSQNSHTLSSSGSGTPSAQSREEEDEEDATSTGLSQRLQVGRTIAQMNAEKKRNQANRDGGGGGGSSVGSGNSKATSILGSLFGGGGAGGGAGGGGSIRSNRNKPQTARSETGSRKDDDVTAASEDVGGRDVGAAGDTSGDDRSSLMSDLTLATHVTKGERRYIRNKRSMISFHKDHHLKGHQIVTDEMLKIRTTNGLSFDQNELTKARALEDPTVLIGYQIVLPYTEKIMQQFAKHTRGSLPLVDPMFVYVIIDAAKDNLQRTEYKVSNKIQGDMWVRLQRSPGKGGLPLRVLRKVFDDHLFHKVLRKKKQNKQKKRLQGHT